MVKKCLYIGILFVILSSCSKFEKLRKSPDNNLKYRKALEYYNRDDYDRASILFDDISTYFRGSTKADTISFYLAMCNYKLEYYEVAGEYFKVLFETYQYSPFAEEAEYMSAYCYYLQSPRPDLDQEYTLKGIEGFQGYLKKYPNNKNVENCKSYITELQDKLVDKSYLSAKLYYDMGYYKSSIVALNNSLQEFPNTKHREKLMWFVLDSNFQLARISVPSKRKSRFLETIDAYYSFVSEFPQSTYKTKADAIYEEAEKLTK
jgi:outer membrane protein assembly factor BamD